MNKINEYVEFAHIGKSIVKTPIENIINAFIIDMGGSYTSKTSSELEELNIDKLNLMNHPCFHGYVSAIQKSITPLEYEEMIFEKIPNHITKLNNPYEQNYHLNSKQNEIVTKYFFKLQQKQFEYGYELGKARREFVIDAFLSSRLKKID